MVEDINYTIITDVQITERTKTYVRADNATTFRQGTSGTEIQASTETSNQVNLKFEGAKPPPAMPEDIYFNLKPDLHAALRRAGYHSQLTHFSYRGFLSSE